MSTLREPSIDSPTVPRRFTFRSARSVISALSEDSNQASVTSDGELDSPVSPISTYHASPAVPPLPTWATGDAATIAQNFPGRGRERSAQPSTKNPMHESRKPTSKPSLRLDTTQDETMPPPPPPPKSARHHLRKGSGHSQHSFWSRLSIESNFPIAVAQSMSYSTAKPTFVTQNTSVRTPPLPTAGQQLSPPPNLEVQTRQRPGTPNSDHSGGVLVRKPNSKPSMLTDAATEKSKLKPALKPPASKFSVEVYQGPNASPQHQKAEISRPEPESTVSTEQSPKAQVNSFGLPEIRPMSLFTLHLGASDSKERDELLDNPPPIPPKDSIDVINKSKMLPKLESPIRYPTPSLIASTPKSFTPEGSARDELQGLLISDATSVPTQLIQVDQLRSTAKAPVERETSLEKPAHKEVLPLGTVVSDVRPSSPIVPYLDARPSSPASVLPLSSRKPLVGRSPDGPDRPHGSHEVNGLPDGTSQLHGVRGPRGASGHDGSSGHGRYIRGPGFDPKQRQRPEEMQDSTVHRPPQMRQMLNRAPTPDMSPGILYDCVPSVETNAKNGSLEQPKDSGSLPQQQINRTASPEPVISRIEPGSGPVSAESKASKPNYPSLPTRAMTPDTSRRPLLESSPEPGNVDHIAVLNNIAEQTEALCIRYAALRADRQKLSASMRAMLEDPKHETENLKSMLDQHLAMTTISSSLDICFAKMNSLACRKEEAFAIIQAQMEAKLKAAENANNGSTTSSVAPVKSEVPNSASAENAAQQNKIQKDPYIRTTASDDTVMEAKPQPGLNPQSETITKSRSKPKGLPQIKTQFETKTQRKVKTIPAAKVLPETKKLPAMKQSSQMERTSETKTKIQPGISKELRERSEPQEESTDWNGSRKDSGRSETPQLKIISVLDDSGLGNTRDKENGFVKVVDVVLPERPVEVGIRDREDHSELKNIRITNAKAVKVLNLLAQAGKSRPKSPEVTLSSGGAQASLTKQHPPIEMHATVAPAKLLPPLSIESERSLPGRQTLNRSPPSGHAEMESDGPEPTFNAKVCTVQPPGSAQLEQNLPDLAVSPKSKLGTQALLRQRKDATNSTTRSTDLNSTDGAGTKLNTGTGPIFTSRSVGASGASMPNGGHPNDAGNPQGGITISGVGPGGGVKPRVLQVFVDDEILDYYQQTDYE